VPSLETTLAFFGLSLLLGFTPGPDNLFVVMQAAAHGRRAGWQVVLGLCTGLVVHSAAVALGLAAVFAASQAAFTVLKTLGATYLVVLAWQAWRAPATAHGASSGEQPAPPMRLYLRGIVMNLTNPKVVLFFLAFLPQFVDTRRGPVALQLGCLGLVFIAATLVAFGTLTCVAGFFGRWLRASPLAHRRLQRVAALVFAGLAVRLALAER